MEPLASSLLKYRVNLEIPDKVSGEPMIRLWQFHELHAVPLSVCVVVLLQRGWTPLIMASDIGRANLVRLYLECGAHPNSRAQVRSLSLTNVTFGGGHVVNNLQRGWTALMSAAKHDAEEVARILLENGANAELAMVRNKSTYMRVSGISLTS